MQQDVAIDLFALGIVNFRKLRSVANTLQERRFTSVRPANYEDSEVTYAIEVLLDFRGIQLDFPNKTFCGHVGIRTWIEVFLDSPGIQLIFLAKLSATMSVLELESKCSSTFAGSSWIFLG